jgi:DNA-binding NtrC family response regulator
MKILIIEDDDLKMTKVLDFLRMKYADTGVDVMRSWKSGLRALVSNCYDLTILDMSLPTFDIGRKESGGAFNSFGGEEILKEIKRRSISTKVIVFTQFEYFGDDAKPVSLKELSARFEKSFSDIYIDTVFFSVADSEWEIKLSHLIDNLYL